MVDNDKAQVYAALDDLIGDLPAYGSINLTLKIRAGKIHEVEKTLTTTALFPSKAPAHN